MNIYITNKAKSLGVSYALPINARIYQLYLIKAEKLNYIWDLTINVLYNIRYKKSCQ